MKKWFVVLAAAMVVMYLTGLAGVSSAADAPAKNRLNSKAEPDPDSGLKSKPGSPADRAKSADAPKAKADAGKAKMNDQKAQGAQRAGVKSKPGSPGDKGKSADAPKAKPAGPKGSQAKQKAHGDPHVDNKTR
jgi:hypothetical protein